MKKFVLWGTYCDRVLEQRAPYRQAHLEYLQHLHSTGQVLTIGPTQDLTQVFGIYCAADEATARALVEADPYWQNHIWTGYQLHEWIQAI
jgi:uncharacterized protein YciI